MKCQFNLWAIWVCDPTGRMTGSSSQVKYLPCSSLIAAGANFLSGWMIWCSAWWYPMNPAKRSLSSAGNFRRNPTCKITPARLDNAGHKVAPGSRELADRRFVEDLIVFHDPAGNRIELVWNPQKAEDPFTPGRPIDGFKTGPLGMGHAVLHVPDATALLPFYRDVLGFAVSDYGLKPVPLYFFHVNGRHHSFAIVSSGNSGFHHFMVEYHNLDDVGQGYDLACQKEDGIAYTLGRHTNDHMTSFYANSPSGFFVENGWGGRVIDPATWEPHETQCGPSFWGHDRLYLSEAERKPFVDMRLKAAEDGLRAPLVVDCPWLYETRGRG